MGRMVGVIVSAHMLLRHCLWYWIFSSYARIAIRQENVNEIKAKNIYGQAYQINTNIQEKNRKRKTLK